MARRTLLLWGSVLAAFAAVPALALMRAQPDGGEAAFRASKRAFAYTSDAVSTTATEFEPLPGLDDLEILNRDAVTAAFSGDFDGAPVEVRVVLRGGNALLPGIARFAPSEGSSSFSQDFVSPAGRGVACRTYAVEWRSPTGDQATLRHGSLIVDYRFDDTTRDGLRIACPD